jgi:hypothetical protein
MSSSPHPWKWPVKRSIVGRPVCARATRQASMSDSVPEFVKRTRSAHGTIDWIRSAHSTWSGWSLPKWVPSGAALMTASTMAGWAWPSSRAPFPTW